MMALALSTAVAGLLAVAFQGIFVNQFLLLGVLLLSYVGLAAVMGGRQAERGEKVAYLGQQPQRGRSSHQGRPGQRVRAVGER